METSLLKPGGVEISREVRQLVVSDVTKLKTSMEAQVSAHGRRSKPQRRTRARRMHARSMRARC